jgi:hypothetical protein
MPRIIDLSMAIEGHFRWPVERRLTSDHAKGDLFQVTWLGWPVHGFTTWTARATSLRMARPRATYRSRPRSARPQWST